MLVSGSTRGDTRPDGDDQPGLAEVSTATCLDSAIPAIGQRHDEPDEPVAAWGNQLTGGTGPERHDLASTKLKLADNDLRWCNINAMYLPSSLTWLIIDNNGFSG